MTLLGKLFRPWDLPSEDQVTEGSHTANRKKQSKSGTTSHHQFSTVKSTGNAKVKDTVKSSTFSKQTDTDLKIDREPDYCCHQSKSMYSTLLGDNESENKSSNKNQGLSESKPYSTSGPPSRNHPFETTEDDQTLTSQESLPLLSSKLPNYSEPSSPADFDIYYGNGNAPNVFVYPNATTLNELANLSRFELTAMGLLPPESASSIKVRRQRPKRFHCPHCQVAFSNNGQLRGHIRIHTGERPFVCEEEGCGKSFTRNEELTRHRRIHSGLRPFPCSYCGKKFGRKDHLKKHTRTHQRGVYNARAASLIGYGNPFQPLHQSLFSSTSFATPNELISLESQYSSFSQQQQLSLPLLPGSHTCGSITAATSVSCSSSNTTAAAPPNPHPFIPSPSVLSSRHPSFNGYL